MLCHTQASHLIFFLRAFKPNRLFEKGANKIDFTHGHNNKNLSLSPHVKLTKMLFDILAVGFSSLVSKYSCRSHFTGFDCCYTANFPFPFVLMIFRVLHYFIGALRFRFRFIKKEKKGEKRSKIISHSEIWIKKSFFICAKKEGKEKLCSSNRRQGNKSPKVTKVWIPFFFFWVIPLHFAIFHFPSAHNGKNETATTTTAKTHTFDLEM